MSRLAQDMKKLAQNIQVTRTSQLNARHIAGYIHERLAQGISLRTLQNEMAMVRSILAEAGRTQLSQSELISNQSLGISGASRDGMHQANSGYTLPSGTGLGSSYRRRPRGQPATGAGDGPAWPGSDTVLPVAENLGSNS